jgi:hypothetical protein
MHAPTPLQVLVAIHYGKPIAAVLASRVIGPSPLLRPTPD